MTETKPSRSTTRYWQGFAAVVLLIIVVAAIRWSRLHPFGTHWDEAQYLDEVALDTARLRAGLLVKVAGRILVKSWGRPPAYRVLALPVLAITGFSTTIARLITLACYILTCGFIYLGTKRLSNELGAALAVLTFCLSAQAVSASLWFSSEGPLYLATSALLYFLFCLWTDDPERISNWVGLGLALALGLLSKSSFVLIGFPALALGFVAAWWKGTGKAAPSSFVKAGVLGVLIAAPWWIVNLKAAVAYAGYARGFVRNSLGSPSLGTWMRWLGTVLEALLGFALSAAIVVVVCVFIYEAVIKKEAVLTPLQKLGIAACACAGVPIVVMQLLGTNHLLRHISPSLIPLGVCVGILAGALDWTRSWIGVGVVSLLLLAQLGVLLHPVFFPNKEAVDPGLRNGTLPWRIMALYDQWDWAPVEKMASDCGLADPKIAYLGNGRPFDQPQIQFPWARDGSAPEATWIWRYEDGPVDWKKVMEQAEKSDFVITAPNYVGEISDFENLDNQYNSQFASELSRSAQFKGPVELGMGRFQPVQVLVFENRQLACAGSVGR